MIMMANMMQKLTQEVVEKKTKLQELHELMNGVKVCCYYYWAYHKILALV